MTAVTAGNHDLQESGPLNHLISQMADLNDLLFGKISFNISIMINIIPFERYNWSKRFGSTLSEKVQCATQHNPFQTK